MIYIQSNADRTLAHHFDCSCALYGAIETMQDYRLTTIDEVLSGKFDLLLKTNLFVGSTDFMRAVFGRLNKNSVKVPKNSNRKSEILTLKDAHERVENTKQKLFIKPYNDIKLFTGLILDGSKYSCLMGLPDDTLVLCYDVFDREIISEWRLYIFNNKIVDARNYSGDFMISPDYNYTEYIIRDNKDTFPIAYTIDIGILDSYLNTSPLFCENVVIEFNDMWAIGNYGIPNDLYLRLLKERYFQIVKN